MEQWKELQLLKSNTSAKDLGLAWPELQATGLSRADLCNYLMAFGENGSVKAVDFSSITSQADCKALAAGGLTVAWHAAKGAAKPQVTAEKKKEGEPKTEETDGEAEKKDVEVEKKEEEEEATTTTVIPEGASGKCVANTAITGDRRTHAVAAGLRALLQLDNDSPDATKANVIDVAPTDATSELSPAFAPLNGIRVAGMIYKSPDHYLAAQKAELFSATAEDREKILNAPTAEAARKLGTEVKEFDQSKWEEHRPEAVFAAVIAAVYATRRNYYTLITSGQASFSCDGRPAWAVGLQDARLFLMCRDFGAHLFNHPNIGFTINNRITLLGGIKGHGVKIQALCEDCLAKPRAIGSWQRLLYSLRHGRNLASAVNRSGVILLISDLLYKESTDQDITRLCINVCAAIAEELNFLDKEVCGFLIKYYLNQRDTWCVLGSLESLLYSDEVSKQAYAIFFSTGNNFSGGGKNHLKSSLVDKNDIYHRTHAAKALSKLLTSPKATVLASRMSSPESVKVLIDTLVGCQYHSSLGGWNDLISDLSSACMKCLLLVGKHLATKKEDLTFFVPKLTQFLSCAFNDDVQSHCAVLLEKTSAALDDAGVVAVITLVKTEFLELKLHAPDRAEDLCDLLAVLVPRSKDAADLLFALGITNFSSWAMPVLTTAHAAIKAKSPLSKVEGFYTNTAVVLRQALHHSDDTALEDLVNFADVISQQDDGVAALQELDLLAPLLQWVTEIDAEEQTPTAVQDTLGNISQRLTAKLVVSDEKKNLHIIQLLLDVLTNVQRPKIQSFMLQCLLNLAAAGTTKDTFEGIINLQALTKTMVGKPNQATTTKLLANLEVKVAEGTKADKKQGGENAFQQLIATKEKKDGGDATAVVIDQISAKKYNDKENKKKNSFGVVSHHAAGGKYAQRVSVVQKKVAPPPPREVKQYDRTDAVTNHTRQYNDRSDDRRGGENRYTDRDTQRPSADSRDRYSAKQYDNERDNSYVRRPTTGGYKESAYANNKTDRYGSTTVQAPMPVTAGGPTPKYRDTVGVMKPGGGTVVSYAKEAKASVTEDNGARVFKTQAKGSKGVNLGMLNQEISQSRKPVEKKPTTWAGVAKFANEREEREERAVKDAAEQKRLLTEERERIESMRKKAPATVAPLASIDPVSELFKKLLPGGAAVRSVVSTDRDMMEMEADKRKMEQRQAERDRRVQYEEERKELESKKQAETERLNQMAERQRREQETRREQEEHERQDRVERERQEVLRKARADAERAAAAVSGGVVSWNTAAPPQQSLGSDGYDKTAAAIKSSWDTTPATINNNQQQGGPPSWGTMPAAQPAPLGGPNRGVSQPQFSAPPAGNFGMQQQGGFSQQQQQQPQRVNQQQFMPHNQQQQQGPVGGRPGHNNTHPWQQQQQQTQQMQQHWQGQQAQFRVQQQQFPGGGQNPMMVDQRNFSAGGIPPPMHQAAQGIPQQQLQHQQQPQQQPTANANYYQTSQASNNNRLNAGAGAFDGRLQ